MTTAVLRIAEASAGQGAGISRPRCGGRSSHRDHSAKASLFPSPAWACEPRRRSRNLIVSADSPGCVGRARGRLASLYIGAAIWLPALFCFTE